MPSFIAPCPRGHIGNFVTHDGYHHCFCGMHVPVFEVPKLTELDLFLSIQPEDQARLMEQYIQEGIAERVEDAIANAWREIDEESDGLLTRYQDRLRQVDPEWSEKSDNEFLENLRT